MSPPSSPTPAMRPRARSVAMLERIGVIPVLRCDSAELAIRVAAVLAEAGLPVVEITMTVPGAIRAIAELARRRATGSGEGMLIGAGTVTDAETARRVVDAGAEFVVSPCLVPDVIEAAQRADVAVIPGALTPTEIFGAARAGADLVKVFPAQSVGGAAYIRALRGPFPQLPLVPTGGVNLDSVTDFFRAGATAVGVGSELLAREWLEREDWPAIAARAGQFLAAVAAARAHPARPAATV